MEYQLVTVPPARRALKKLPRDVRQHLLEAAQALRSQPYKGEQLRQELRFLHSFHTVYRRTHYRVIYEIDEKNKQVLIRYAASRENFYRSLHEMKLKSLIK